ncbi:hypothetical protein K488DRAFT_47840 [Vararia minispora EC-137]|uniref:Uncharacterized protein n=1 Tax=Vararia minispora EC-137 TaxID=1314806 RepID=A0ACB8QNX9_9AGAM|nr:hypothetical protein K488DRAFT_47840 [Vararia minispora EC-137]
MFILGVSTMTFASFIRLSCFRSLGHLFTFELTIRPKHVLVRSGPYAYVRHPSYTAAFLSVLAFVVIHYSPGAWAYECVVPWRKPLVVMYLIAGCYSLSHLWRRGPEEDARLRAHFGGEWEDYRASVPWSFIPLIY